MRKRLLSALLAMAMMLTMLPVSALATNEDGATAEPVTLTAGFKADATEAEKDLGITHEEASGSWCDPNTMYVKINNAVKGDTYKVVVTNGSDEVVWTEPATGNGFEVSDEAVTRKFARTYFAFGTPADGHSISDKAIAAGVYTFTVTRTEANGTVSTLTTTLELAQNVQDSTYAAKGDSTATKTIAFTDTGFAMDAADANEALGVTGGVASTQCDPDTMWAKFSLDGVEGNNYSMKVTHGANTDVYTEETMKGTFGKAYFTLNADLVAAKKVDTDNNDPDVVNHSVADVAVAEGTYTFVLTAKDSDVVLAQTTLELGKVTLDAGTGATVNGAQTATYFGEVGTELTLPKAVRTEDRAESTGWNNGQTAVGATVAFTKAPISLTAVFDTQGTDKEISEVAITLETDGLKVGSTLPKAETETEGVSLETKWYKADGTEVTEAAFADAGTYKAVVTVTAKGADGYTLAADAKYTLNSDATEKNLTGGKATIDVTVSAASEVTPVLQDAGFSMDDTEAKAAINAALTKIRDGADEVTDVDTNTMFVAIDNLKADSAYELDVTVGDSTTPIYTEEALTGKTETVVYFTFNGDGGSHTSARLAAGTYTFTLKEVKTVENKSVKTTVGTPVTLDVYKVEFAKGTAGESEPTGDAPATLFAAKGGAVTIPDGTGMTSTTHTFAGWKDADKVTYAVDQKVTLTGNLVLTAQWLNKMIQAPASGGSTVEIPKDADPGVKDNENVLKQATVTDASMTAIMANKAVQNAANDVALKLGDDEITKALADANADGGSYDKLQVQVYLEIAPTSYVAPENDVEAKLVVDITPKYQVVAINSNDPTAEAKSVAGKTGDLMDEEGHAAITESVTITVALPEGFVVADKDGAYPDVYVAHRGKVLNGEVAAVAASGTENDPAYVPAHLTATFTNEDGFSEFVITAANPTKASVGAENYTSLKDAVDAQTGATATIEVYEGVEAAVVNKAITITLKAAAGQNVTIDQLKALLKAGTDVTLDTSVVDEEAGTVTFTFTANDPAETVATIDSTPYPSLQAAVDAVTDGGTITLVKDLTKKLTAEVKKEITFTVALNNNAADKVEITVDTEKFKLEKTENKNADTDVVESITYKVTKKSTGGGPGPMGGGGSGATTYSVNVPTTEHGTVTVNPRNAAKDATVTITVSPNQGYILDTLTVTDKDGNNIELTKVDSNKYTFKMPASRVEIKASFKEGTAPADGGFTDITSGEYYYDAVLWAVDKGITTGLTETTFGPNASCTRAQMVTFLWRAAGSPEPAATTAAFTDIDANEYYYKAVLWAVEKGITTGATETTFAPNATVTRAQTVTFLYRYAGKPAVSGSNGFTDLEAGEYYVDAVQWAATNGITTGTTETTFSPANNCTRGQIVTFLYRHIVK